MNIAGLYLTAVLIWGSSWFVINFQIGVVHEAVSVFYRFLLAAILMLTYCVLAKKRMMFSVRQHVFIALQGGFLFCLNYVLIYYATAYISSGLVAVVFSTLAIWNIFNGALFLKKRIQPLVLLGAVIGLFGIALIFGHEFVVVQNSANRGAIWTGLILVLLSAYSASLGNIISARNQADDLPVLQTNAFGTLYGSLILLVYALSVGADFSIAWTVPFTLSLLYLTVFGTIVAFGAYLSLIGKIGADKAAYAMVVFPVVALIISTVFEGFIWTPIALLGMGLVVVGNVAVIGGAQISRMFQRSTKRPI